MTASTTAEGKAGGPGIAYLFSRYPVPSQTFCDREMLAHEAAGFPLLVLSLNPPGTLFRHDHFADLAAETIYPPAQGIASDFPIADEIEAFAEGFEARYGDRFNPRQRSRNAAYFASLLKQRGIRHCHVHFANQATITALFMKQAGISYSFTAHGQDFTVDLGSDGVLQELVAASEFVVGVSNSACHQLRQMCPGNDGKIHRIYNGIDFGRFAAAKPATPGPLKIISIGRLIGFKGFLTLVEACGMLRDRGIAFRLTIVGEGPLLEELQEKIRSLDLEDRIVLAGLQTMQKIRSLLAESHVFALGSIVDAKGAADTLPTVIAEAMTCSLPVVSTRVAGIPEMVDEEETGLLVEPGDATAMADALARLAADPEARQSMGRAGREKAERTFELESCAAQLRERLTPYAEGRALPDILCLTSDGTAEELGELAQGASILRLDKDLPEASVIEAQWLARGDLRTRIEEVRTRLPRKFQDLSFYTAARQAVALAQLVKARGIQVIHAVRSDAALPAHLLSRITDVPVTATIEPDPVPPRPLLRAILPSFSAINLADSRLAQEAPFTTDENTCDFLLLSPAKKKKLQLGMFRFTRSPPARPYEERHGKVLLEKLREIADA